MGRRIRIAWGCRLVFSGRIGLRALWLTLLVLLSGPGAGADGKRIYERNCSVCHGDSGDGRSGARFGLQPPPASFVGDYAASREQMVAAVSGGVPGTAMAAWAGRLTAAEIESVVDYIRKRFVAGEVAGPASPLRLHATGPTSPMPSVPPAPVSGVASASAQSSEAARLYGRHCSVCHGETGRGAVWGRSGLNPPPLDFTAPDVGGWLTRERMIASVRHGRPGTAMSAFEGRLDAREIESIVDFIRTAFMPQPASGSVDDIRLGLSPRDQRGFARVAMDLPFPEGLGGDFVRGGKIYGENCAVCHGHGGRGDGPRAYFIYPTPRDFSGPDARVSLNRPALFAAVTHGVRGRAMPGWRTVLDPQEVADVSEYVFRAFVAKDEP